MINLFYYILNRFAEDVVFSGLSMTKWSCREGFVAGSTKKCIAAFLNPKDDIDLFESPDHTCLKLSVPHAYCRIADRFLYEIGLSDDRMMEVYWKNLVQVNEFTFGTFLKPEALITSTVIPGRIMLADKKVDSFTIVDDNRQLYINNHIEMLHEARGVPKSELLYHYYKALVAKGRYEIYGVDEPGEKIVFVNEQGAYVTLDVPCYA